MENETKKIKCIVCECENSKYKFIKNSFHIYECKNCGTHFVYPLPSNDSIKDVYDKEYFSGAKKGFGYVDYDADKEVMRQNFIRHLKKFESHVGVGSLLDIGAATGYFISIANDLGWQTQGIEISSFAAEKGRNNGLNVHTGTIEDIDQENSFDVVTMWDVVEHMDDPRKDISIAYRLLKNDGLLAINTPDSGSLFAKVMGSRWHLVVPPEHIWYFNKKSLSLLLDQMGFEPIYIGCVGKSFTFEYIVNTLHRWQGLSMWKKLLNVIKGKRIGKVSIPINLYDNMYILARKKRVNV